jgi:hypothetical protein
VQTHIGHVRYGYGERRGIATLLCMVCVCVRVYAAPLYAAPLLDYFRLNVPALVSGAPAGGRSRVGGGGAYRAGGGGG